MLARIGVESIDDLFAQIPDGVRLDRPLELPDGMSESEVYRFLAGLADTNLDAERIPSFLGAGMYDHYVPAIVDAIVSRSEFLTPYTPYQPEVSQGGLQVMFEFQTAMSEITGLPVSNAGLYEGLRRLPRRPTWQWARPNEPAWLPRAAFIRTAVRPSRPMQSASGRP